LATFPFFFVDAAFVASITSEETVIGRSGESDLPPTFWPRSPLRPYRTLGRRSESLALEILSGAFVEAALLLVGLLLV